MKDINGELQYRDKTYRLVFNLNVMEEIQQEYGSIEKWGKLTDGSMGEPDAKAVKFGFMQMLNEGIDINNDELGLNDKPFTMKQIGRMITEIGLLEATSKLNSTVIDSTKDEEKNL